MAKYGPKAEKKISKVMHEYGEGKLRSGRSAKPVRNQKQAVAIGISEARREGDKVPSRKLSSKSTSASTKSSSSRSHRSGGATKSRSRRPSAKRK